MATMGVSIAQAAGVIIQPFNYEANSQVTVDEFAIRGGLLYDVEAKKIVWQKDMGMSYPIASLTKMMVALLTVEDINAGKFTWEDKVSWERVVVTRKKIGRRKYKSTSHFQTVTYSLRDVFKNTMIASNNEAAEQMAKFIGCGDMSATIARMNERAVALGMEKTYYGNPSGLPGSSFIYDNSASSTDLLKLTLEMLNHPVILDIAGLGYTDISNGKGTTTIRNHNRLTIDFTGEVDGMKTGYTKRAGFCLVATVKKCDHRLISIVLGARDRNQRNEVVKDMVNDYYAAIGKDPLNPSITYYKGSVKKVNGKTPEVDLEEEPLTNALFDTTESTLADTATPLANTAETKKVVYETTKKIHKVKRGEHLNAIADKYNCSVSDLKSWNKLRTNKILVGQRIVIQTKQKKILPNKELHFNKNEMHVHIVQKGDTLFNIAQRYNCASVEKLKSINGITDSRTIKVGDKIKVPVGS
jgi:serine-type D-Ala-D-Ala carboxypeptidase (penicillin-binding protein 5/6)